MPLSDAASDHSHIVRYERLQRGAFYADFRRDRRLNPEVYHCVIQREGSAEILRWTQHRSLEEAKEAAQSELSQLTIRNDSEQQISARSS
ncbi:MAG TPA: hypothetical protein VFA90_09155 [Terriglobales bacterium]|nr:hypothetical protein [Terriglobales bacterium]